MRRYALLFVLIVPIIVGISIVSNPALADKYAVEDGDYLDYGYQMLVEGSIVETRTEANPFQIVIASDNCVPPGLYEHLIGMYNGQIKTNIIIPPEDGFLPSDPTYGAYAGKAVTFNNLQIYKINGYHYTELPTQPPPKSFGFWLLTIGGSILGVAGAVLLIYGGYRFLPKLLGKRCLTCKKSAVGQCKNCGKAFCNTCYSAGCPNCKGRSLIRFS
jgi:hypothetical protein